MKTVIAPHDLSPWLVSQVAGNGALLVGLAKLYLGKVHRSESDARQFTVFHVDGRRGLVRLNPGASCEKGIGREHIKSPDFYSKFDVYLKPVIRDSHFEFTAEEPGAGISRNIKHQAIGIYQNNQPQGILFARPKL